MVLIQQKKYKVVLCLLIFSFIFLILHCGSQNSSPLKIKGTKRANKLLTGDRMRYQELKPSNPATHVVLDLSINGISTDNFNNADGDSKYIMSGGQIYRPHITQSGIIGGKKKIRLCVVVPKNAQELTLHIGTFPPKTFKVKGKIYNELKDWE